jgi:hypothetical protein
LRKTLPDLSAAPPGLQLPAAAKLKDSTGLVESPLEINSMPSFTAATPVCSVEAANHLFLFSAVSAPFLPIFLYFYTSILLYKSIAF